MRRNPKNRPKKADPRYRGLRPWKKGQSGNPKGRPKGSRNKLSHRLALDKLVRIMESKRTPAALQIKGNCSRLEGVRVKQSCAAN
jgi:hypothetical protein